MQNRKQTFYILLLLPIIIIASCRKRDSDPSKLEVVSYPVIHAFDTSYYSPNQVVYYQGIDFESIFGSGLTPSQTQIYYFSFPVGAGPALSVSAYDSATAGSVPVDTIFNGHYNPNQPGLYIYQFNAKSSTGFGSLVEFVVAVTNYTGTPIVDTNGFVGIRGTDTISSTILEIANGLYFNLDGPIMTNALSATTLGTQTYVPSFFVQTDSTHIIYPTQPTNYNYQQTSQPNIGLIGASDGTVSYANGIPTVQYKLVSDTLNLNGQTVTIIGQ